MKSITKQNTSHFCRVCNCEADALHAPYLHRYHDSPNAGTSGHPERGIYAEAAHEFRAVVNNYNKLVVHMQTGVGTPQWDPIIPLNTQTCLSVIHDMRHNETPFS